MVLERLTGLGPAESLSEIAGIGLADVVEEYLRRYAPWLPYPKLLVGAGVAYFGDRVHPLLAVFGRGIFKKAAADILTALVRPMVPVRPIIFRRGGGGSPEEVEVVSPEEYIKAKYGV